MKASNEPTWKLILWAVEQLAVGKGEFRLDDIIRKVQERDPDRGRPTISPVVQGMTSNAGKGPLSPCGQPLFRISHGLYRLNGDVGGGSSQEHSIQELTPRKPQLSKLKNKLGEANATSDYFARGYVDFQEDQVGVSYDSLFGPYLQGAFQVTLIDPYIRLSHQARNMMEFIETVRKFNTNDSRISVKLITIEDADPETASKQQELLKQVQIYAAAEGIQFIFEFDDARVQHDRVMSTDTGWKIVLGRGLDIFKFTPNDLLGVAIRNQLLRRVRKFGITYVAPSASENSRSQTASTTTRSAKSKTRAAILAKDYQEYVAGDVVLVGCVKTKMIQAAAAKDLFISPLFRKEREYAEGAGVPWYILSAENGLVTPDQLLSPYDRFLPKQSAKYRKEWGDKVIARLEQLEGPLDGKVFEIHAGVAYVDAIRSGLESRGAIISEPLKALSFGGRLRWYGIKTFPRRASVETFADEVLPDISSLVASLRDESSAVTPKDFLAAGSGGRKVPGMYSWWVDADGASELAAALGHSFPAGLIYAGLAGATHWPSGKQSTNTLWSRMQSMHLGNKHEFSTLRRSVGAILASAKGRTDIDEIELTSWLDTHLRVQVVPFEDADVLGRVEKAVLAELDPPLNIKGMTETPLRQHLKDLRRAVTS